MKKLICLFLMVFTLPAMASDLAFTFGEDVVGAHFNATSPDGKMSVMLGASHQDDFDIELYEAGLFANGTRGQLLGRVGAKALYADLDAVEGPALAFGADLKLRTSDLLYVTAGFYYAPSGTSFDDLEGYREWNVGLQLMLFENSALEFGVGDTEVKLDLGGDVDFLDGGYIKLKLIF